MTPSTNRLIVTTPSDTEIAMTREFNAPKELVFEAYTTPELLKRWLGVMHGWVWAVCEVDLRVGGAYRYVWRGPDGVEMGMGGTFTEVTPPSLLRATERFDEAWYPGGDAYQTLTLTEKNGRTTLVLTVRYASKEARDVALQGMEDGVATGFDNLANVLAELLGARK